jgi:WD40 repeat protein
VQRQLDAPQAPPRILGRHEGDPTVWAWPGSERLGTGDGTGEVRVWDADRGRLERSLRSPASARFLALDPSERYIAAAPARGPLRPRSLHVFDLETPRGTVPFALLDDENGVLNDMSFHPRGRLLASGHYPNGTFLWNLTTPRSMVLRGHNGPSRIVFAPDGRLVSMASAGDVRVWPLWTSPESEPLVVGARGQGRQELRPGELEISGDGGLAVVAEQSQRRFWLLPLDGSPGTARERTGDDGVISGVTLAPDDRRLAFGLALWGRPEVASIRILDLVTGERRVLRPEDTTGACVMNSPELGPAELPLWLPDGRLVSEGALGLRLWDLEDGSSRLLRACRDSTEPPRLVATPDSSAVLTLFNPKPAPGESSTLLASELATGVAREITAHGRRLLAIGLDPTGKALVTGDMNGVVRVGAIAGGEPHLLYGHSGPVTGVAVSPDGRWIASASDDDTIRLWPMPDLSKPPLHTLPYDELLEKLRSLTNLRVVPDPDSATGYTLETAPFPGWKDLPTW